MSHSASGIDRSGVIQTQETSLMREAARDGAAPRISLARGERRAESQSSWGGARIRAIESSRSQGMRRAERGGRLAWTLFGKTSVPATATNDMHPLESRATAACVCVRPSTCRQKSAWPACTSKPTFPCFINPRHTCVACGSQTHLAALSRPPRARSRGRPNGRPGVAQRECGVGARRAANYYC